MSAGDTLYFQVGGYSGAQGGLELNLLSLPDTDFDVIPDDADNCPSTANQGQENFDGDALGDACDLEDDGDGYTDVAEAAIGTNRAYPCGFNGWPSNLEDAGFSANKLDISDIVSFVAPVRLLDKSPGPGSPYNARWDLAPGPNTPFASHINIIDLTTMLSGPAGSPAHPPMFGGLRAFGRTCPLTP